LAHLGSCRVEDTTYLGMRFSLSAHSPVRAAQRAKNHSSLRRPSSRASAPSASSVSRRSSGAEVLAAELVEPAAEPEALLAVRVLHDPVDVVFVVITILPMSIPLLTGARTVRPVKEIERFFDGKEMIDPGVVGIAGWRPAPRAPGRIPCTAASATSAP
jgi:hypothetical protein